MTTATGKERDAAFCDNGADSTVYLHEILNLAIKVATRNAGISGERLCDLVAETLPESALTPENLRHLANDRASTFVNPLGLVIVLARLGESELLARMARAAGFILVPGSPREASLADVLAASASYQKDVGESLVEVSELLGGKLTKRQVANIMRELDEDEVKRATLRQALVSLLAVQQPDA